MERAETQQGGDDRTWRKHVSTDLGLVNNQSSNVWEAAGSVNFERVQELQVREWPQLAKVEKLLQQTAEECWVYSWGTNQGKRLWEKCNHIIIPLLNLVFTSSL